MRIGKQCWTKESTCSQKIEGCLRDLGLDGGVWGASWRSVVGLEGEEVLNSKASAALTREAQQEGLSHRSGHWNLREENALGTMKNGCLANLRPFILCLAGASSRRKVVKESAQVLQEVMKRVCVPLAGIGTIEQMRGVVSLNTRGIPTPLCNHTLNNARAEPECRKIDEGGKRVYRGSLRTLLRQGSMLSRNCGSETTARGASPRRER